MDTVIKISNKNWKVDTATRRITFLDNRFYLDSEGNPIPSVTTILEAYPKGAGFYKWLKENGEDSDNIRDEAGRRGSIVHDLTERYERGEEISLFDNATGNLDFNMMEWAMFERYVEFRSRYDIETHSIEETLVSPSLGYAGTLDRDITMNGKRYIVDIKTSGGIWDSYWLQLKAYHNMKVEQLGHDPYDGLAILWLNAKTKTDGRKDAIQGKGWQMVVSEDRAAWQKFDQTFRATRLLWEVENGNATPKQMSYQLSHKLSKAG